MGWWCRPRAHSCRARCPGVLHTRWRHDLDRPAARQGREMSVRDLIMAAAGSPAYRYWRLFVVNNAGATDYVAINEIELRETVGSGDMTSPSTPVSTSTNFTGYPGSMTVSNDLSDGNLWISATGSLTNQWLTYIFAAPVVVREIAIFPQRQAPSRSPGNFRLEGSNDGVSFAQVAAFSALTGWGSEWRTFSF